MFHSDINTASVIYQYTPEKYHKYLNLMRLDRPAGAMLLLSPLYWSLLYYGKWGFKLAFQLIILTIAGFAMRSVGCILNDIADVKFDRQIARTQHRALASGAVAMWEAGILIVLLMILSALSLLVLTWNGFIMSVWAFPLVIIYPYLKRWTYYPQVMLGFVFSWGVLVGSAMYHETLAAAIFNLPTLLMYLGSICWVIYYDTVYAFQDMHEDELLGVKSLTFKVYKKPKLFASVFVHVMFACLAFLGYKSGLYRGFYMINAIAYLILLYQIIRLDINNKAMCLSIFKQQILIGLIIAAAFV